MTKCNQTDCDKEATHEYVWPTDGETKYSCEEHAKKAQSIAGVLGYTIKVKIISTSAFTG